ncbi:MAG: rod-binding protein [Bdellovibrionales bacterium]|nr:rod-binding protein [Bdellovibrionales bacterium]
MNRQTMQWGDSALTAPTTPARRVEKVDRAKADPQNVKAAEGMEAMFLDYLMQVMRQTVPKNDMDLESPATGIYRSMQDSEIAQIAARNGGIGLADQIIAYLESQRYTLPKGAKPQAPETRKLSGHEPVSTGGTHEGQSVE